MPVNQYVLSPSESKVLRAVHSATDTSMAQLAAELRFAPDLLRKIIRRLQKKGLIELNEVESGREYYVGAVKLTDSGIHIRQLLSAGERTRTKRFARLWAGPSFFLRRKHLAERVLILPSDEETLDDEDAQRREETQKLHTGG